ncbi:secretory phospholipase A2, partial [Lophiotrema nucula]
GAASDPALIAKTDHLIFNVTIEEFIQARNLGLQGATSDLLDPRFDFASDGCSSSPDHPLGFDFQPACYRHDFGYRNYHKQNRFNEPNREKLDNNLYMDLLNVCAAEEKVHRYKLCWDIAKLYFKAVRKFGDGHKA